MKNLGRIFILFVLLLSSLYGGVSATLSPKVAYIGDVVTYSLKVEGSDIEEPSIYQLCGQNVISTGSRTNIEMIGTDYKKTRTLVYQFIAKNSCTVEPVSVTIDGKRQKTQSVKLTVKKQSSKAGRDFILEYSVPKTELYVGESFDLMLKLKQKQSAPVVDSKFLPSEFKGFWKKSESKPEREEDSEYIITTVHYTLTPQREGNITILPAELRIASRVNSNRWAQSFMPQLQWKSYFSNEIAIDVKPLPNNAELIGDFTIKVEAEKTEVHANEAVNVIVKVKGQGNLEDINSFKPHIDGVNIFDEKIQLENSSLTQKLVFVGDHDFTIEPFVLTFFDTKTKQLKRIATQPIEITVKGSATTVREVPLTIKKDETETRTSSQTKVDNEPMMLGIVFVLGVIVGILIMFLKGKSFGNSENKKFSYKDEKQLLIKLLPYKEKDDEVKEFVELLERNLYSNEKESLDKKRLKEIVKRYDII